LLCPVDPQKDRTPKPDLIGAVDGGRARNNKQRGLEMRRLLAAATFAGVIAAGGAFAGEVKGPPGTANNTNATAAPEHANSACAFSGLNDFDEFSGQNVSQVQTAADSWKFYGLPQGAPGTLGLCRGSN
jgi:hypothetical protein